MSHQSQQTPKQQLSEFTDRFGQTLVATAIALVVMALIFAPILSALGVFDGLRAAIGDVAYLPYFVASWVGATLFFTANAVGSASDEIDDDDEDEETVDVETDEPVEELKTAGEEIFRNYASIAYISLVISVGAFTAAFLTVHVAPAFGIVVAVILPVVEMKLSGSRVWFLGPSNLLAFPAFLALIPITLLTMVIAFAMGMVIALSQTLKKIADGFISQLHDLLLILNTDTPALDPFKRTFNRR